MNEYFEHRRTAFLSIGLLLAFNGYFGNSSDEGQLKRCCSDVNGTACWDSCNWYLEKMRVTDGCVKDFNRIQKCNIASLGTVNREICCRTSSISSKCLELCSNYDKWIVNLTLGCGKQRHALLLCFIETAVLQVPPSIRNTQRNIPFQPNQAVTIECDARGKPNVTKYWWKKNGINLPDGNNRILEFNRTTDDNEGYYRCYASNKHGTAVSDITHLRKATTPTREPHPDAPVFDETTDGPCSVIVTEGCNATFRCNASADPDHVTKIEWFLNGDPVNAENRTERFDFSDDNRILTIRNVCRDCADRKRTSDLMVIQCNASNQHGYAFRSATLNILKKTKVKTVRTNATENEPAVVSPVDSYTNISICCVAVSDAVVALGTKLTWYRKSGDGPCSPVPEGSGVRDQTGVTASDNVLVIRIEANDAEAWSRLGGEYVCLGKHRYSWDEQAVTVNPNAPVNLKLQKTTEGVGVVFACSFSWSSSEIPVRFGKFRWYLENEEILNPIRQTIDNTDAGDDCSNKYNCTSKLTFHSIPSRYFGGRVRCVVEYQSQMNFSRSLEGILPYIPEVSIKSSTYDVYEKDNFTLTCTVTNFDQINTTEVTFHWYEDGQENSTNVSKSSIVTKSLSLEEKKSRVVFGCRATTKHGNTTSTSTIQNATITVLKKKDEVCQQDNDSGSQITWPLTKLGGIAKRPCPNNATGDCWRNCSKKDSTSEPEWSEPDCSRCVNKKLTSILDKIGNFEETIGNNNRSQVASVVNALSDFTNETKDQGLKYGDLSSSVNAVAGLVRLQRKNEGQPPKKDEVKSAVRIISNLLEPTNAKSWTSLQQSNESAAATLMAFGESYGRGLTQIITNGTDSGAPVKEEGNNVALEAVSKKVDKFPQSFRFPSGYRGENRSDLISLAVHEKDIDQDKRSSLNVWSLYYDNINEFLPSNSTYRLNSRVLSLSVAELKQKQNGKDPMHLEENVSVTLQHVLPNETGKNSFTCVYWEFDPNDVRKGSWKDDGCMVIADKSNDSHTVCSCKHLTNFAVLMSRIHPAEDKVLDIISKIGCAISALALLLTIVIYAATWNQVKSHQAAVLLNLCIALLIAYIIFLFGVDNGTAGPEACTTVAALLHYFFLAAFCLMLAEGVQLFICVYFVFHVRQRRETAALIVAGWVLPLIIVAVSLGITKATKAEGYGNTNKLCWLDGNLIWAFAGPVFVITAINIVIIVAVLRKIVCTRLVSNKKDHDNSKIRKMAWSVAVLCPVLGIAWLFGVLSIAHNWIGFQYIFTIANSFQGLFIFIFHGLYNNKKSSEKISSFVSEVLSRTPFGKRHDTTVTSAPSSSSAPTGPRKDFSSQDKKSLVDSSTDSVVGKEGNPYCGDFASTALVEQPEPIDVSAQVHAHSTTTTL